MSMSISTRRSRNSRLMEDGIENLIIRLQALLPHSNAAVGASNSKILKETCRSARKLHKEVDDLCEQLAAQLFDTSPGVDIDEAVGRLLRR